MKRFLILFILLIGCIEPAQPRVRTPEEIRYCVDSCILRNKGVVSNDKADLMGYCELSCR